MPSKTGKPKAKKKSPAVLCSQRKRDGSPCRNPAMRDRDVCSSHARLTARKTLLNTETTDRFVQGLASGVGIAVAAAHAGISRSTAHAWLDRAEKEHAAGKTAEESEFVALLDRVSRTRASVQVRLAAEVQRAGREESKGDWRAAAWMLERLAPAEFGSNKVVQHEHTHEGTISMELLDGRQPVDIPLEKREQIIALLEAGDGEVVDGEVVS